MFRYELKDENLCSSTTVLIIICAAIVCYLHTIFQKTEPFSVAAHSLFSEMLAGSSYRATFETHLGNGLPADCPFKIHISLAAMCRNL